MKEAPNTYNVCTTNQSHIQQPEMFNSLKKMLSFERHIFQWSPLLQHRTIIVSWCFMALSAQRGYIMPQK